MQEADAFFTWNTSFFCKMTDDHVNGPREAVPRTVCQGLFTFFDLNARTPSAFFSVILLLCSSE